eukprot:6464101-Amphidinium_carterae.1
MNRTWGDGDFSVERCPMTKEWSVCGDLFLQVGGAAAAYFQKGFMRSPIEPEELGESALKQSELASRTKQTVANNKN